MAVVPRDVGQRDFTPESYVGGLEVARKLGPNRARAVLVVGLVLVTLAAWVGALVHVIGGTVQS
jgi:hypothetical protein